MALISKQFEVMTAIRAAIVADSEITAVIPAAQWRVQKRAWHRFYKWDAGGFIVPIRSPLPPFENRVRRYEFRALVVAVYPSDTDLTDSMAARLAIQERIDSFFAWTPKALLPAPLQALVATQYSGTGNQYALDSTTAEPGEQFTDGAFQAGLDALATVVTVTLNGPKQDYSTLGA